jgi:hypothetical protein
VSKPLTRSFVLGPEHDAFLVECAEATEHSVSFVLRRAIERAMRDPLFLRGITTISVNTHAQGEKVGVA